MVLYTDDESVSGDTVTVPDFKGLTVAGANDLASVYDLNISIVGSNAQGEGTAYSQDIKSGTKVQSGTVIAVNFEQDSNYGSGVM